jgi:serine/threonine-protein kinase HipA
VHGGEDLGEIGRTSSPTNRQRWQMEISVVAQAPPAAEPANSHPRNHAVIAKDRSWKLSPAYELTPSVPVSLERRDLALECGDHGRYANAKNILSQHARFLLARDEAEQMAAEMKAQVEATWYDTVRASGVSLKDAETIRGAFVYPGFSL